MDRMECPLAAESGDFASTTCLVEDSTLEFTQTEVCPMSVMPLLVAEPVNEQPVYDAPVDETAVEQPPVDVQPTETIAPVPQLVAEDAEAEAPAELTLAQIIEALLFASDTPLSAARLAELAGSGSAREVERQIAALNEKYAASGLTFRVEPIARGYQLMTVPAFKPWLAKLDKHRSQTRLSAAALETLSIVAYKQPVIRADVEAIRGVACGDVLNRLREMGLVKIAGRAEIVGRPLLYGTTRKFLDIFGLGDLDDLPPMETLVLRRPDKPSASDAPPQADIAAPRMAAAGA